MSDKAKRAAQRATPQETTPLQLSGPFLQRVTTIPNGSASLIATLGEGNGKPYLVPFVDLSLIEELSSEEASMADLDPGPNEAFARIVTLDNAAHIVRLLAAELAEVCREYDTIANEKAAPEPSRFRAVLAYFKEARESLEAASTTVEGILKLAR
ncbi:hypothetical protein [Phenylobacterium sp.]|uniref:hypothetical protein n=1 Tax=Phenylobacterium sp. TaxID=1871053 RepID=UPI002FE15770